MKYSLLLSLAILLAAASPLDAAWSQVSCGSDGYAANSTYEANLRRLLAVLPAEASSSSSRRYVRSDIGYWPNRLQSAWSCWLREGGCAACIADAINQVERECPYRREATFFGVNCSLFLSEYRIFGSNGVLRRNMMIQTLASAMIFQAFGLACIFFLFLRIWRESKKATIIRYNALPSGDQ